VNARAQLALGWYQVVGGLAGLLSAGLFAAKGIASMGQALVLVAVAAFFLALGAAGALLLREHGWAKPLSIAVQALQIPKLFTALVSYELYSPFSLTVELRPARWNLATGFEVGGGFNFGVGAEPLVTAVGINLAAAGVLWLLLRKPAVQPVPTTGGLVTR
jgi:hypothetical protein